MAKQIVCDTCGRPCAQYDTFQLRAWNEEGYSEALKKEVCRSCILAIKAFLPNLREAPDRRKKRPFWFLGGTR